MGNGGSKSKSNSYGTYLSKSYEKSEIQKYEDLIAIREGYLKNPDLEYWRREIYQNAIEENKERIQNLKKTFAKARELLSGKGKPESIEEALERVNLTKDGKQRQNRNCQRCVIAYELRRRGYKVEAEDFDGWGFGTSSRKWRTAFAGMSFENIGAKTRKQTLEKMGEKMKSFGEGARAIVSVDWNERKGHVFNAEWKNGSLILTDAQTGKYVDWSRYNTMAKPTSIEIARVDKLEPTQDIVDIVRKGRA